MRDSSKRVTDDDVVASLLLRLRDGEREVSGELLQRLERPLAGYFLRGGAPVDRAADLVQEVFMRLWQYRKNFEPTGSGRAYVFRIAQNVLRRRGRELAERSLAFSATPDPGVPGGISPTEAVEQERAVQEAVASLPGDEREILLMAKFGGLRYAEIGEALGISVKTVEAHITRAFERLRRRLRSVWEGRDG